MSHESTTMVFQNRLSVRVMARHMNGTAHRNTCARVIGTNDSDQRASRIATLRSTVSAGASGALGSRRFGNRTVAVTIGVSPERSESWIVTPWVSSAPMMRSRATQSMRSRSGSAHSSRIWLLNALPMPCTTTRATSNAPSSGAFADSEPAAGAISMWSSWVVCGAPGWVGLSER